MENTITTAYGLTSDHALVTFNVNVCKPRHHTYGQNAVIGNARLCLILSLDLRKSKHIAQLHNLSDLPVEESTEMYHSELTTLIDKTLFSCQNSVLEMVMIDSH